jgi:threonine/homoserine/homoserine lactone efflux protein
MYELWSNLAPLVLVSAALPLQTIVTLLLVSSSIRSAYAWVAGMTTVRLLQGVLFSVLLTTESSAEPKPRQYFLGGLLLVLALVLYVKAIRAAMGAEDEDAPPPKWITKAGSMSPRVAFGAGAGFMTVSVKFLVFTLAAISAIGDADLPVKVSVATYLLFVVLAQSIPFTILALASSSSSRSSEILDSFRAWLQRNNRVITIIFGLIFGTWFLFKAFSRLNLV